MAGVNKVIIVGRLGNEPEMRVMPNGDAVAHISIATGESWTDKNTGEQAQAKTVTSPQPQAGTPADNFDDDIPF